MKELKITDVRVHKGDSAFLIDDGDTAILYDTGFAFTGYAVADKIKAILGERKLDYILLTHSHYDHALGSAYALKYWPDAKVVAGEYVTKIFAKPSARAVMRDLDRKVAKQCNIDNYEDFEDLYTLWYYPGNNGYGNTGGAVSYQQLRRASYSLQCNNNEGGWLCNDAKHDFWTGYERVHRSKCRCRKA